MPQRTPGDDEPTPDERKRSGTSLRFPTGMSRTQQMGNRGLAAASIGWTLAGCIILGFVAGSWLDRRFGTQFWTPILLLVGVAAGFRELFRTVSQLDAANKADKAARARAAALLPTPVVAASGTVRSTSSTPQVLEAPAKRERLFVVPPPPFMEQPVEPAPSLSAEEVKRRLSDVGDDASETVEEKRDAV